MASEDEAEVLNLLLFYHSLSRSIKPDFHLRRKRKIENTKHDISPEVCEDKAEKILLNLLLFSLFFCILALMSMFMSHTSLHFAGLSLPHTRAIC